jgi:hypothetical protein
MASSTTFGATIVPQQPKRSDDEARLPPPTLDSPALTPAVSREDLAEDTEQKRHVPPHSPFYQHISDSTDRAHSRTASRTNVAANEKDLEAGVSTPLAPLGGDAPFTSKVSLDCNKECKMWPSKQTLMESRKAEKKKKREGKMCGGCGPLVDWWGGKTKRQRLIIEVLIGLVILGIIIAIAVGITVAVNGTVYVSDDHKETIPQPNSQPQ